jgi:diguanylate cyclase (GGDEF)-like protein
VVFRVMASSEGAAGAVSRHGTAARRAPRPVPRAAVGSLALLALAVIFAGFLNQRPARVATDLTSATAQTAVVVACLRTARRTRGAERRWRLLIGLTAAGAALLSLLQVPISLAGRYTINRPSPGYLVGLLLYAVALAGLLSLPTNPVGDPGHAAGRRRRGPSHWYAITLLDCVLIVGSIVLLEWGTVLGTVVRTGASDHTEFLVALIHPIASLILATAVVLIACFRQPRSPATLALLGTGLLVYALTVNSYAYRIARGRLDTPEWGLVGFTLAFLLIFLAVMMPIGAGSPPDGPVSLGPRGMWAHAVLPYVALGAAGVLVAGKLVTGSSVDRFETYAMVGLVLVALLRQMATLAENTRLLAEVRERERQLHHQAFHDPLTGLANRALFTRRLLRALGREPGDATDTEPLSVMFLDLDGFKLVNDTYGHAAGDELLQISAQRLRVGTRAADTVARLGGDEFAVILDGGGRGREDPRAVGERLVRAVQAPCLLAGRPYTPRASLGLVTLDGPAALWPTSPDILLHQADLAMYAAKREGTGRPVVYRPELALVTDHGYLATRHRRDPRDAPPAPAPAPAAPATPAAAAEWPPVR